MKRTLLAATAALAVLAGPATAATVKYKRFVSPSGDISCYAVKFGGKGVECMATYLPEIGELDSYLGLEPRGKARYAERGDYPGFPKARERTLAYGDSYKRKGVRCTMRESGLTCRNRDDHGFHLSRDDIRRF